MQYDLKWLQIARISCASLLTKVVYQFVRQELACFG